MKMVNGISKYCYPLRYSLRANMFPGSQHSCSLISPKDLTNPYNNYENFVGLNIYLTSTLFMALTCTKCHDSTGPS